MKTMAKKTPERKTKLLLKIEILENIFNMRNGRLKIKSNECSKQTKDFTNSDKGLWKPFATHKKKRRAFLRK